MNRKPTLFLLGTLTLSAASLAAPDGGLPRGSPQDLGFSAQRLALVHEMLAQHVEDGRVAGLVAGVARHGESRLSGKHGMEPDRTRQPNARKLTFSDSLNEQAGYGRSCYAAGSSRAR